MAEFMLYSYWRSSCSYRVRIALELKGLAYEYHAVHLVRDGGEQHQPDYNMYVLTIDQRPNKPSFSEDRFRIRANFAMQALEFGLTQFAGGDWREPQHQDAERHYR